MKPSRIVQGCLAAAAAVTALGLAPAPSDVPSASAPAASPEAGLFVGPTTCGSSSCHGSVTPRRELGVRQDEYFIWQKRDLHAQAYGKLFNEESRLIARRLGIAQPGESPACIGCHTLAAKARQRRGPLDLEDGVSCESCHGAASGWLEGHRSESWTHRQSVAAGMTDLRDVAVRSAVCLSCHLGAAGKAVDHDLIAAGHPLLAFELDNYTESMAVHWLPFAERQAREGRDGSESRDTHGVRAWAVGQADQFRHALDQLARRARAAGGRGAKAGGSAGAGVVSGGDATASDGTGHWPELSELSCDTCHHSLGEERWRTARPVALPGGAAPPRRPGLPRFSLAHYAVLRQLVAQLAPDRLAALDAGVDELAAQLAHLDAPPVEVAATAGRLARQCAELVPVLDQAHWDAAAMRRLLAAIARDEGGFEAGDYASAQQATLAVQTLVSQLQAGDPRHLNSRLAAATETLVAALQSLVEYDAGRFAEGLAALRRDLQ